ncbi:MAG: putative selenium-dependent hydroxylase accessory protein YqeC [Clostridia bacterium]|nr:putative selenium-dependent hydroxylase accessory protein YqeC [Clostridia bacterium]
MYRPFEAFNPSGKLISVIGSGGKTTFLRYLSSNLPGTVILTTSTHIWPFPDVPLIDTVSADREQILSAVRSALARSRVVCFGKSEPSGKLADPSSEISFEDLLPEADHILVEADGAAGRPLKAHRPWEPVIPACSGLTICLAGASGLGRPVSEACHCPELFASLAGITPDTLVSEEHIAAVLNREALADCYLINQTDILPDPERARLLCGLIARDAYPCSLARL